MNKEQDNQPSSGGTNSGDEQSENNAIPDPDFHGAAIVDEDGKETEITEEMVRKAIHDLDEEAYPELDDESE